MPSKRKEDDPQADTESVHSSSSTVRASKRSRSSLSSSAAAAANPKQSGLNSSNDQDETTNDSDTAATFSSRAVKRSRSSTVNKSQMNSSGEQAPETTATAKLTRKIKAATATAAAVTNHSSGSVDANLHLYLEELFDLFSTYQDETYRYLAIIFYILPSPQVNTSLGFPRFN